MRQQGLALLMFHDLNGCFPASGWTKSGPGNQPGSYVGWQAMILPLLEQDNVHARYDWGSDWWEASNLQLGAIELPIYRCPSAATEPLIAYAAPKPPRPALWPNPPLASSDYAALMGIRNVINPVLYPGKEITRAVLYRNSRVRISDVRDGTSQTIVVTECSARPTLWKRRKMLVGTLNDQGYGWLDSESGFSLDGASNDGFLQGLGPEQTPCAINATNENEPYSFHSGGCLFVFADGHAAFKSDSTELAVLAALTTKAGGEVPESTH